MKFCLLFVAILFTACSSMEKNKQKIVIDLEDANEVLNYSSFADSVSYITLNVEENITMGEVQRLYKWKNYYYIGASSRDGVLIYDTSGNFVSHINAYGEGPKDFRTIASFAVVALTGDVCIYDNASQKMIYYDINGTFKYSVACSYWTVDIVKPNEEQTICISPLYAGGEYPAGIWLVDKRNEMVKYLRDDVTADYIFYYYPVTYLPEDNGFYYYDRNWDDFSWVTTDTTQTIYQFDFKQKIPATITGNMRFNPVELDGYGICDYYAYSPSHLLIGFCQFIYEKNQDKRRFLWALVDNRTQDVTIAKKLHNDFDETVIDNPSLFYLDSSTWVRVCDESKDDFGIRLQLLHLKK